MPKTKLTPAQINTIHNILTHPTFVNIDSNQLSELKESKNFFLLRPNFSATQSAASLTTTAGEKATAFFYLTYHEDPAKQGALGWKNLKLYIGASGKVYCRNSSNKAFFTLKLSDFKDKLPQPVTKLKITPISLKHRLSKCADPITTFIKRCKAQVAKNSHHKNRCNHHATFFNDAKKIIREIDSDFYSRGNLGSTLWVKKSLEAKKNDFELVEYFQDMLQNFTKKYNCDLLPKPSTDAISQQSRIAFINGIAAKIRSANRDWPEKDDLLFLDDLQQSLEDLHHTKSKEKQVNPLDFHKESKHVSTLQQCQAPQYLHNMQKIKLNRESTSEKKQKSTPIQLSAYDVDGTITEKSGSELWEYKPFNNLSEIVLENLSHSVKTKVYSEGGDPLTMATYRQWLNAMDKLEYDETDIGMKKGVASHIIDVMSSDKHEIVFITNNYLGYVQAALIKHIETLQRAQKITLPEKMSAEDLVLSLKIASARSPSFPFAGYSPSLAPSLSNQQEVNVAEITHWKSKMLETILKTNPNYQVIGIADDNIDNWSEDDHSNKKLFTHTSPQAEFIRFSEIMSKAVPVNRSKKATEKTVCRQRY